jgi:hypothetical protein
VTFIGPREPRDVDATAPKADSAGDPPAPTEPAGEPQKKTTPLTAADTGELSAKNTVFHEHFDYGLVRAAASRPAT